jgi:hypothetical protein
MIDFIKLRNLIVEKKCVSSNDYGKEDPFIGIYWEDLIDIINHCDSTKWISVDEALPEFEGNFSEYCIIRTENGFCAVTTYYRTSTKEYWWNFEKVKVTHWMPIPEMKGVKK